MYHNLQNAAYAIRKMRMLLRIIRVLGVGRFERPPP